jgi:hypothetical protein
MNLKRGLVKGLDVEQWYKDQDKIEYFKQRRHEKRNEKRRRLGKGVVIYPEDQDDEDGDDEKSEADHIVRVGGNASEQKEVHSGSDAMDTAESDDDDVPLSRRTSIKTVQAEAILAGRIGGKRGPFEDDSSDDEDDTSVQANARKKRSTAAAAEKDRQKTVELQKRKKGMAVPASKSQHVKAVPASQPATVTKKPTGPTKPSGFFETLKRPPQARLKPPAPSASGGGSSSATTQTATRFTAPTAPMMVGGPSGKTKPVAPTGPGMIVLTIAYTSVVISNPQCQV